MNFNNEVNAYIQPQRGKFIESGKVVAMFPQLAEIVEESKKRESKTSLNSTFYVLFVGGSYSHSTWSYDDASDFLFDNIGSQGFQISWLTGLQVCADQRLS